MGERTYVYGMPGRTPAETLAALVYEEGVGRLVVKLRTPFNVPAGREPLVHEQFMLQPAELDWWNALTGRGGRGQPPGDRRRAQFWRLDLWLDSGRCLGLPVTLHRPLKPGSSVTEIRLHRQPRGPRRALTLVTFVLKATDDVWGK